MNKPEWLDQPMNLDDFYGKPSDWPLFLIHPVIWLKSLFKKESP